MRCRRPDGDGLVLVRTAEGDLLSADHDHAGVGGTALHPHRLGVRPWWWPGGPHAAQPADLLEGQWVGAGAQKPAGWPDQLDSPLAARPYDLRHACVSLWLNAGVPATQVAEWAGHSVHVLMGVYAKCVHGQEEAARRRVEAALGGATDLSGTEL